ncbi:MAG: 6-bladed beta-propeller [Candidatus Omnitrophota bacterium]
MKIVFLMALVIILSQWLFGEQISGDIYSLRKFTIDRHGNIYTDGEDEHSINKYSPDGKFLLKIGRKGEGPSDIKRLGGFTINPIDSTIYVTEYFQGNKWISKFSTDGKFLGILNCELDRSQAIGLSTINFDNKGNIYVEISKIAERYSKDSVIGAPQLIITKFSPTGKRLKDIYKFSADAYISKDGSGSFNIPFRNELYWTISEGKIIVVETHSGFISVLSTEGKLEKRIPLPFPKEKLTGKDMDAWENKMKDAKWVKRGVETGTFSFKYWRGRIPLPDYKPVVASFNLIDSHGNLYCHQYVDFGEEPSNRFLKVDLHTGKSTMVTFNQKGQLFYIDKNYFYFTDEDEDGDKIINRINEKDLFKKN